MPGDVGLAYHFMQLDFILNLATTDQPPPTAILKDQLLMLQSGSIISNASN